MEEYQFKTLEEDTISGNKVYVLIIYDITNNRSRKKLADYLLGYGFRIQKSCFEALVPERIYQKIRRELKKFADEEDSIRVYKIIGHGQVTCYGRQDERRFEDIIIL